MWIFGDKNTFLFSLTKNTTHRCNSRCDTGIKGGEGSYFVYGNGHDLIIYENCNLNNKSYSQLGYSYDLP